MFSTKGRYAIRVMIDLAEQDPKKFEPLEEIAERQEISKKYLEIILKNFVKNNLLEVMRGRRGGYRLTRKPSEYTVGEILELAEGTLNIVACLEDDCKPCKRKDFCKTLPMWKNFDKINRAFWFGIKLSDLANDWKDIRSIKI